MHYAATASMVPTHGACRRSFIVGMRSKKRPQLRENVEAAGAICTL
jgi:hypothetical protein